MKLDRQNIGLHIPWAIISGAILIGLVTWYVLASSQAGQWLGGGSLPGLVCGIVAGSVILFEMLLWPRKYWRKLRLFATKYWMVAHIWLGLISLPLAIVHCGFHLGGALPTWLMVLFILTILSGVYGLVLQNILPKMALKLLPGETIYSQIDYVSERNLEDIKGVLLASCGPRSLASEGDLPEEEPAMPRRSTIVVGRIREVGKSRGRTLQTETITAEKTDAEILWSALDTMEGFLRYGKKMGGPLGSAGEAQRWFSELRRVCEANSERALDAMEQAYELRKQFDLQRTLHHWLHAWIPIHIGLSVAVTVLLLVHIVTAIRYW